eukprot:1136161-Pelagomonas_calceolata.AAC.1
MFSASIGSFLLPAAGASYQVFAPVRGKAVNCHWLHFCYTQNRKQNDMESALISCLVAKDNIGQIERRKAREKGAKLNCRQERKGLQKGVRVPSAGDDGG